MGYLDAWKILDEMIADFREKGGIVPPETMVELKSAKTLISILEADSDCVGIRERIEKCLFNAESYIMSKGQMMLGIEYVDKWSNRLNQASKKPADEGKGAQIADNRQNLPSGLPRGPNWVRISLLPELQIDKLRELADESQVSCILQDNDGLLVYGEKDQLKGFIKKVALTEAKQWGALTLGMEKRQTPA